MPVSDTALNELRLHGVNDILFLLTHRLTQGVALTTGEVGQQSRQQHHLLLIHRDAIGILQIFLHHGDIVGNGLATMLTVDEIGDIAHRSRTIQGVHSDEVFEDRRLQLAQVFLHTCRLKLERTDGAPLLIEFKGLGVVDGNRVEIDVDASGTLDIQARLFQLRKRLQSQEVHLDQARRFNHVSVILCTVGLRALEVRIISRRYGHMIRDRVTTDDKTTGMDTRTAHRALEHLRILHGIGNVRVG